MTAAMRESALKCTPRSLGKLWCSIHGYLRWRMKPIKMGNMPVSRLILLVILTPLKNSSITANLCRKKPRQCVFNLWIELVIHPKDIRCFYALREQIPYNLVVHRDTCTVSALLTIRKNIAVLRRYRRTGHKISVNLYHKIKEELCSLPHYIKVLTQKFLIPCIEIMCPLMCAQPCSSHHPVWTRNPQILDWCLPLNICIVVRYKAPAPIHGLSSPLSVREHLLYQTEQRLMALRQITVLRKPVIHLCVDVDCIFAVPRWKHVLIPESLQGCRKSALPAAWDKKISAKIKVQLK